MTTFAERQLAKYGWEKGQGLGKNKGIFFRTLAKLIAEGMTRAITASVKADTNGV